jgi:KUP system potassium uptake protein
MNAEGKSNRYLFYLTLGALGVVFGDIGTSPLYAFRECFYGSHPVAPTADHVLGVLSLIIWSLILVVSIKYLIFVLRADNKGEGGELALTALVVPVRDSVPRGINRYLIFLGLVGASLLYGDGIITPAISVLSAVEGLSVATTFFDPYVVPITVFILTLLFLVQRTGTGPLGTIFGPVVLLWFFALAALGINSVSQTPEVFQAVNPLLGFKFLREYGFHSLPTLGSVVLVITGTEALYADMGHFGRRPIRLGWSYIVFPGLALNYLGQGALLLRAPTELNLQNPFYNLAPAWALYPLVGLATAATVIASQALISGAFSLTRQAVQLGYLPRMVITHTSSSEIGQIYVPKVNWLLWIFTVLLVLAAKSSSNLAGMYGIAVSTTMVITTFLFSFYAVRIAGWNKSKVILFVIIFLGTDLVFFAATTTKLFHGGWFPLLVAAAVFTLMSTWFRGRMMLSEHLRLKTTPLEDFLSLIRTDESIRVPGIAFFIT